MALHIDGPQRGNLSAAIENAFPAPRQLQRVIERKLDDNIYNYVGLDGDYQDLRFSLIQQYNARYHIDKLVLALLEQTPDNAKLQEFVWQHQIVQRPPGSNGQKTPDDDSLERMLDPQRGFTDPMAFLRRFGQIVKCVCRIAVPSDAGVEYGTGFLIGNETIMTNYHVLQALLENKPGADRNSVRFLFDYHTGPDGQTVTRGVEYKLIDDDAWLIDSSKYDQLDLSVRPAAANLALDRSDEFLDYAIVRVADTPGKNPLGEKATDDGEVRSFLPLPTDTAKRFDQDFKVGKAALFMFQHPSSKPLRLDWEKPAILGVNGNRTRTLYDVNTEHGSSGAPCFNQKLELMALHHAGGKDWPAGGGYLYNQGMPIGKIYELLAKRNKLSEIF